MSISPRILYVDDDPEGCALMAYWLHEDFGYDVILAQDGNRAKQCIEQEYFDLYLLDYCLPDVTATSLCREIKVANPAAQIIIYSALDRDVDRSRAIGAGADFYFVKPEQRDLVGSELRRIFGAKLRHRPVAATVEFGSPPDHFSGRSHQRKKAAGIV